MAEKVSFEESEFKPLPQRFEAGTPAFAEVIAFGAAVAYWQKVGLERIAAYDAPFSLRRADSITLHINGTASPIKGLPAQPLFDDTGTYWFAQTPTTGVVLPATGTTIRVLKQSGTSMKVEVGKK